MVTISAQAVKDLRERTGAGFMECKSALTESNGDVEKAIEIMRLKGIAKAAKKAEREAQEGIITSYIHGNGKIGVLLEINCETDFVARTDGFKELAQDICLQIAAMNPLYLSPETVPADVIEQEKRIYEQQAKESGKPQNVLTKIAEGKLVKFYQENCLTEQVFIKDDKKTIKDVIKEKIAQFGENIIVGRYVRFQLRGKTCK